MTSAAMAAKAIREELKIKFPNIKFKVRSQNYSNGNSVNISYKNAIPEDKIEAIVNKYQYGNFNGMIDLYEMTNDRKDIPQAKYIFVNREIDQDILDTKKLEIAKKYGIENPDDNMEWLKKFNQYSEQIVWKEVSKMTI